MLELGAEQRVVLNPCDWATYESILAQHADRSTPRFTYSDGMLEIMSPSPEHEELTAAMDKIVDVLGEELGIHVRPLGSTTQRRVELQKGVEPDCSYFINTVNRDPDTEVPDLVVEVEVTRSAIDKLPIFARLGVAEVWRFTRGEVKILGLHAGEYRAEETSRFFPVSARELTEQMAGRKLSRAEWGRELRAWIASR